jgi:hypothetical protein
MPMTARGIEVDRPTFEDRVIEQTASLQRLPDSFDRNPRYERNGGPWISLVQEYFIFRNSRPPPVPTTALQFSPRVDACWTPDHPHLSEVLHTIMPFQELPG